ncbi:MAG: aminoglycoside phosphotransferase family protein [Gemmatimonadota bacterium]
MSAAIEMSAAPQFAELRGLVATMLARGLGRNRRIRAIEHRPSSVRSSFAIEEVDVILDDGELLRLVLKVLGSPGILANARTAKPLFLHDPLREIELYQHILADRPHLGTAMLYSTVVEPAHDRYWLLLERAPGVGLERIDDPEIWLDAARWLARLHTELAPMVAYPSVPGVARLLRHDRDFVRMWMVRAQSIVRAQNPLLPSDLWQGMDRLARRYDRVVDRLVAMPETVIHGEFHASNIVVRRGSGERRFCVVDWAMAAVGPHLLDLAALLAGEADESRRHELALAYHAALPEEVQERRELPGFFEDLAYCRLHQAVQWLGWSPDASPPTYQAASWLGDVVRLAEELDF